ncbi:MAG: nickel insertion protein, partial [Chloroflexota bacterium]
MKIAYCEVSNGLSGGMLLGALVDAGLEPAELQAAAQLTGCALHVQRTA